MRLPEIVEAAEQLLKYAGTIDLHPTNLDRVLIAAGLSGPFDFADPVLGLPRRMVQRFRAGHQPQAQRRGLHGVLIGDTIGLDLHGLTPHEQRFALAHEVGHGSGLRWHREFYHRHLGADIAARSVVEREAEMFADELLFQGDRFHVAIGSDEPSLQAPIRAAEEWGVSAARALRRYVETSPHAIAAFVAPVNIQAQSSKEIFVGRSFQSRSFQATVGPLSNWLPRPLSFGDPLDRESQGWLGNLVTPDLHRLHGDFEAWEHGSCRFPRSSPGRRYTYSALATTRPASNLLLSQDFVVVLLEVAD